MKFWNGDIIHLPNQSLLRNKKFHVNQIMQLKDTKAANDLTRYRTTAAVKGCEKTLVDA